MPQNIFKKLLNELDIKYFDYTLDFCNFNSPAKLFIKHDAAHLSERGHKLVFNLIKKDFLHLKTLN